MKLVFAFQKCRSKRVINLDETFIHIYLCTSRVVSIRNEKTCEIICSKKFNSKEETIIIMKSWFEENKQIQLAIVSNGKSTLFSKNYDAHKNENELKIHYPYF